MLVLPQSVVVKWNGANKKWYIEKGYLFTKIRDEFEVNAIDLTKSSKNYVEVICECCGKKYSKRYERYYKSQKENGDFCKNCTYQINAAIQRKSYEEVKNIFKENNCILLTTEYINNTQTLRFICECGNEDSVSLAHFLGGQRCKECAFNRKRNAHLKYDIHFLKNLFIENGCVLLEDEYISIHTHMRYICVCGRESKIALADFLNGVRCKKCANDKKRGENNPRWNANKSKEERLIKRDYFEYRKWRKQVYERDFYTCQCCGDNKGGNLIAHHIDSYDWCEEKRTDLDNGITLCEDCHSDFHHKYGYGSNTKEQFEEWLSIQNN